MGPRLVLFAAKGEGEDGTRGGRDADRERNEKECTDLSVGQDLEGRTLTLPPSLVTAHSLMKLQKFPRKFPNKGRVRQRERVGIEVVQGDRTG